jgi:hypothetical protein
MPDRFMNRSFVGPPPQVAAIAGKKDGMKQGALGGALKELGYDESQVTPSLLSACIPFNSLCRFSSSRAGPCSSYLTRCSHVHGVDQLSITR